MVGLRELFAGASFVDRYFSVLNGDIGDEAIATLGQSLDETRTVSRVAEGFAQPVDRGVQAIIEIDEGVGVPDSRAQLVPAHNLAGSRQQQGKHAEGLILQPHPHALLP